MGFACTSIAFKANLGMLQIHTVAGILSFRVARYLLSLLKRSVPTPMRGFACFPGSTVMDARLTGLDSSSSSVKWKGILY